MKWGTGYGKTLFNVLYGKLIILRYSLFGREPEQKTEKVIPVGVYQVSELERQHASRYIGTVQPGKTVKLSFKTGEGLKVSGLIKAIV